MTGLKKICTNSTFLFFFERLGYRYIFVFPIHVFTPTIERNRMEL